MIALAAGLFAIGSHAAEPVARDVHGDPLPEGAVQRLGTLRFRPGIGVESLLYSPDGRQIAYWHPGVVTIADAGTGKELRREEVPGAKLHTWAWLADGRGIAIVKTDSGFFVWEFTSETGDRPPTPPPTPRRPRIQRVLVGDRDAPACFAITPDGKQIIAGHAGTEKRERDIELLELATGKRINELSSLARLATHPGNCEQLALTPNGKVLLAFHFAREANGNAKELHVAAYDVAGGKPIWRTTTPVPQMRADHMCRAISNQWLALGTNDDGATIRLWDLRDGKESATKLKRHAEDENPCHGVCAMAFTPDDKSLLSLNTEGPLISWNPRTGAINYRVDDSPLLRMESLAMSPDGSTVAGGSSHGFVFRWDTATGKVQGADSATRLPIRGVDITANGTRILTVNYDVHRIWDATSGKEVRSVKMPSVDWRAHWGRLNRNGDSMITRVGPRLFIWDLASSQPKPVPEMPAIAEQDSLSLTKDGLTLIAVQGDRVQLFDWPSGQLRKRLILPRPANQPGKVDCLALALSDDGRRLASVARCDPDSAWVLDVLDAQNGAHLHRLMRFESTPLTLEFASSGLLLVHGAGVLHSPGGTNQQLREGLHLIEPQTGRLLVTFTPVSQFVDAPGDRLMCLAHSADGRSVFVGSDGGPIIVYETATGKHRRVLEGHRGAITGLAVSADGRRLVSGSGDLTALVWDLSPASFAKASAPPSPKEQYGLWNRLLDTDARGSYQAIATLSSHPEIAAALIRSELRPVAAPPDAAAIDRMVAALNDPKFSVREQAYRDLDRIGEMIGAGLKARLTTAKSAEVRDRLVRLIDKHEPLSLTPEQLRATRALEILEQLRTPAARQLVADLARGAPEARLTRDARDTLRRMDGK
jgi:WD40 repeat protein